MANLNGHLMAGLNPAHLSDPSGSYFVSSTWKNNALRLKYRLIDCLFSFPQVYKAIYLPVTNYRRHLIPIYLHRQHRRILQILRRQIIIYKQLANDMVKQETLQENVRCACKRIGKLNSIHLYMNEIRTNLLKFF